MLMQCPLCKGESVFYLSAILLKKNVDYSKCTNCSLIYLQPTHRLPLQEEHARYAEHQNDIADPRYRAFVQPLVDKILEYTKPSEVGLDFGAGPGPVIFQMLREKDYASVSLYDPVFHPSQDVLTQTYDFIFANEVIEHLHFPSETFQLFHRLLKPGGHLFCGTNLWHGSEKEFESWFYRRDPTHVSFYSCRTAEVIAEKWAFQKLYCEGSILIFSKN